MIDGFCHDGRITSRLIDGSDRPAARVRLADAAAATAMPVYAEQRRPLMTAVLPDSDGVLRARWTA
ncbi:hypothetical protein GCM10010532_071150 [Dactylosporangium siamense]|uniref:Uncharacterized protein n=1 Tax=Dactylosporangium siamense TaxID=685454 RepID=A0A919PRL1_9ACTN|nr:hypothetical protein Dsi01nite_052360 [Dactylosporangium siamense]